MKKYLIFGATQGIGGLQLYVAARFSHVSSLGYETYVFDAGGLEEDCVKLLDLKTEQRFLMPELNLPPYCFRQSGIKKITDRIKKAISYQDGDDVFIEASNIPYGMWGEIFAKAMSGICVIYLLASHTENTPRDIQEFCSFKYDQEMIAGQTDITLPDLFKGYREIGNDKRGLPASWKNPLCESRPDCESSIQRIKDYKSQGYKIIGYFGTLGKPHFEKVCNNIELYVKKHKDNKFLFLSVGSSPKNISEKRQLEVKTNTSNCDVLNIPELYPVPKDIFAMMEACLASWGSAYVAAQGCERVIRLVDDVDVVPQGVMGVTLRDYPYYKQPKGDESLEDLFDIILFGHNYKDIVYKPIPKPAKTYEERHQDIDEFMRAFKRDKSSLKYYDTGLIEPDTRTKKIMKVVCHLVGPKMTLLLRKIVKNNKHIL